MDGFIPHEVAPQQSFAALQTALQSNKIYENQQKKRVQFLAPVLTNREQTLASNMGSKLLNAYIIVRINALRIASAPVLTNTPKELCEVLCIKDNGIAWAFGSWNVFYQYVLADEVLYVA